MARNIRARLRMKRLTTPQRSPTLVAVVVIDVIVLVLISLIAFLAFGSVGGFGIAVPATLFQLVVGLLFDWACWTMQLWALWIRAIGGGLGALTGLLTLLSYGSDFPLVVNVGIVLYVAVGIAWMIALSDAYRARRVADAAKRELKRSERGTGAAPVRRRR